MDLESGGTPIADRQLISVCSCSSRGADVTEASHSIICGRCVSTRQSTTSKLDTYAAPINLASVLDASLEPCSSDGDEIQPADSPTPGGPHIKVARAAVPNGRTTSSSVRQGCRDVRNQDARILETSSRRSGTIRHHIQRPRFSPMMRPASARILVWCEMVGWLFPKGSSSEQLHTSS